MLDATKEIKISKLKCYNSVKVGNKEEGYFLNDKYQISLCNNLFKITDMDGNTSYTSLANVPWFCVDENVNTIKVLDIKEMEKNNGKENPKDTGRVPKKTKK